MVNAIFYKEWLKLRWTILILAVLSIVILINIWAELFRNFKLNDASGIWAGFILGRAFFYKGIMYLMPFTGLATALAQFMPEIHRDRLKLTLRLPLRESQIILLMIFFGIVCLIVLYILSGLILSLITALYFPTELIQDIWMTIIPWMLGGLGTYFATVTILIEPTWLRRVILAFILYGLIQGFYLCEDYRGSNAYSYNKVLPVFILITVLSALPVYYSTHRYQKGVS